MTFAPVGSRLMLAGHVLLPAAVLAAAAAWPLVWLGAPELGVLVAVVVMTVALIVCARVRLLAADEGLLVRNLWSTRTISPRDVVRIERVERLPWYWATPIPFAPMLEVRLRDGHTVRLHATVLGGRRQRQQAAEFVGSALKLSSARQRDYTDGEAR